MIKVIRPKYAPPPFIEREIIHKNKIKNKDMRDKVTPKMDSQFFDESGSLNCIINFPQVIIERQAGIKIHN